MSKERTTTIIISKKTVLQSLLCDLNTFIVMVGAFWFNYTFINGNNFLDLVILLLGIIFTPCNCHDKYNNISEADIIKIEKICKKEE